MVPLSGIETVLEAAAILKSKGSSLRFHLAGSGRLAGDLKRRAEELELQETVEFLGWIEPQEMPATLHRAAIYITMAGSDGASLSLMEAMACGLFPVAADIPANREWISQGVNGCLVPLNRPDLLAECLQGAWRNDTLRLKASEVNRRGIESIGDFSSNMQKIEAAFASLSRQGPAPLEQPSTRVIRSTCSSMHRQTTTGSPNTTGRPGTTRTSTWSPPICWT